MAPLIVWILAFCISAFISTLDISMSKSELFCYIWGTLTVILVVISYLIDYFKYHKLEEDMTLEKQWVIQEKNTQTELFRETWVSLLSSFAYSTFFIVPALLLMLFDIQAATIFQLITLFSALQFFKMRA